MVESRESQPSPLWRACEPAELVWVDLRQVYQHVPGSPPATPPTTVVRTQGLNPDRLPLTKGEVAAWSRAQNGSWLALTSYTIAVAGLGSVLVRHFIARKALCRRTPEEDEPPF
ncbi:hypothetical protein [Lentzea sp. NPDC003310]|uniref:hypothetical protein n=1 Tax=Lentzea sp. NPDC003310 TaxID=3154447 RepID=UPI0033AFEEC3